MKLTKLVVCLLALVTKICFAGLRIEGSKSDESLVEASIHVLESCYVDRLSNVGLAGPSAGSILDEILSRNIVIPAILIDETSKVVEHGPVDRGSRYKLQAFALTASDPSTLAKTIAQVKNSKWWNHLANFLLINWPEVENGCSNAYEILWEAWKMNLLKTNLMCFHRTRGKLIYTFNPYTKKAPFPWQQENTYKGMNGHVWTLFSQEYREEESPCHALNFDKTLDLGGYENRAIVFPTDSWLFADSDVKLSISERITNINAHILMNSLNATWKKQVYFDYNMVRVGVNNGSSDICLNTMAGYVYRDAEMTNLHLQTTLAVITQYPGYKSQLAKLISVLDTRSRVCVIVVLTITLLFFKFYLRQPSIPAVLNLVLIICNAGIGRIPAKIAPRIYLAGLFIFLVTIHGIYQGVLASLLIKKVRLPSVDSIEDLVRSDHTIYGFSIGHAYFNESGLKDRWVDSEWNCTSYVLEDAKAACANERFVLIGEAVEFKLHLSRYPIGTVYLEYIIRPDWPLEERVNTIHGRVAASGIVEHLYSRDLDGALNTLESYEKHDQDETTRIMTFEDLRFAFVILAIGLGCASISFIIEVTFLDEAIFPKAAFEDKVNW